MVIVRLVHNGFAMVGVIKCRPEQTGNDVPLFHRPMLVPGSFVVAKCYGWALFAMQRSVVVAAEHNYVRPVDIF